MRWRKYRPSAFRLRHLAQCGHGKGYEWNVEHALEILSVIARLRTHASRALHEANYKTTDGMSRRAFAEILRTFAKTIERRVVLELSTMSWVEQAKLYLAIYDKENPS
jgi:hypothetical protein